MASDLVTYLMEERETRYVEDLQRTLEETIAARFPLAPLTLAQAIHRITNAEALHRLIVVVVKADDLPTVEEALAQVGSIV